MVSASNRQRALGWSPRAAGFRNPQNSPPACAESGSDVDNHPQKPNDSENGLYLATSAKSVAEESGNPPAPPIDRFYVDPAVSGSLFGSSAELVGEVFAAIVQPQREQQFAAWLRHNEVSYYLPMRVRKYCHGQESLLPLFSGMLFVGDGPRGRGVAYESQYNRSSVRIADQDRFRKQLGVMQAFLSLNPAAQLRTKVGPGHRFRFKSGPWVGHFGWVETIYGDDENVMISARVTGVRGVFNAGYMGPIPVRASALDFLEAGANGANGAGGSRVIQP